MIRTLVLRVLELVAVAFGASVLTFLMIHLVPGDAAQVMLGAADASPDKIAALRHSLGLDRPLPVQYALWIGRALCGDFGTSLWTGRPVLEEIAGRVPVTLELTCASLVLAILLSLPAGCLMATMRRPTADLALRVLCIAGVTIPSFWLGTLLLYGAGRLAPDIALVGWVNFSDDPWGNLTRIALPTIALALPVMTALSRVVRAAMLEAIGQDYIRTARAKGLSEIRVIGVHALRNALIPFTTTAGIMAGYLFGGSVVVEQVFALPGLGRLMIGAISERNYPLIQAAILLATATFVLVNFAVDLLYAALDPRARSS